jgi:hypothetical protein
MPSAPHGDKRSSKSSAYYWAGGQKVRLAPTQQIALDLPRAEQSALTPAKVAKLARGGRSISDSLVVLDDDQLDADDRAELLSVAALHPVYRSADGTLIVVLPEVRLETTDPDQSRTFIDRYSAADLGLELVEQKPGRFTISLNAGTGNDALQLANDLVESSHPELAQARFVRLMDRPEPKRSTTG